MPAVDMNDPHSRFRSAARSVSGCLKEIEKLDEKIREKEYLLEGVKGVSYDKASAGKQGYVTDDTRRLQLMEEKDQLEKQKEAYQELINWVFDVMEDIKDENTEYFFVIYSVYICHRNASDVARNAERDPHHISMQSRKVIDLVMSKERMNQLNRIEQSIHREAA